MGGVPNGIGVCNKNNNFHFWLRGSNADPFFAASLLYGVASHTKSTREPKKKTKQNTFSHCESSLRQSLWRFLVVVEQVWGGHCITSLGLQLLQSLRSRMMVPTLKKGKVYFLTLFCFHVQTLFQVKGCTEMTITDMARKSSVSADFLFIHEYECLSM